MEDVCKLIEKKNKTGIGLIIILLVLLITPWCAFLLTLYRILFPKLKNVPKWLITNNISLGSSLLWGSIVFLFGVLCYLGYSGGDMDEGDDLLAGIFVWPLLLTGFLLIIFPWRYSIYVTAVSALLGKIIQKNKLSKDEAILDVKGVRYQYQIVHEMLKDLQDNEVIQFTREEATGDFFIAIIHPLLKYQVKDTQKVEQWVCDSCGGHNTYQGKEKVICEYCGTEK